MERSYHMNSSNTPENSRNIHTKLSARRSSRHRPERISSLRKAEIASPQKPGIKFLLNKIIATAFLFSATAFGADVPITGLPAASSINTGDIVPIVQSGTTKKATFVIQKLLWDTYYQPLDADLTALATLSGTHTIYYRSAPNTWSSVTIGSGLDFTGATLSAPGTGFAPSSAHYLTNQAESGLSAEINLGALSTGLLKGTVSGSVSTISAITDNSTNWDTAYI